MEKEKDIWRFFCDVGGTFTDCVALSPKNEFITAKVLSSAKTKGRLIELKGDTYSTEGLPSQCQDFFKDYSISIYSDEGVLIKKGKVISSTSNSIRIDQKENFAGCNFELESHEEAPVLAIRQILDLRLSQTTPTLELRLATTKGTNALLERKGVPPAFITTSGFADILEISTQQRPELFNLEIIKQAQLTKEVFELEERIDAKGKILQQITRCFIQYSWN